MKKKSSMRNKVILTIFIGCLVPYFLGGIYLNLNIKERLYNNSIESSNQVLYQVSELLNKSLIDDMSEQVNLLASLDVIKYAENNINNYTRFDGNTYVYQEYQTEEMIESYFRILKESHTITNFIFLATENGDYMEYPHFLPDESYDPRVRPWYKETVHREGTYISEPYLTNITKEMVISFTKQVRNNEKNVGVVGISVSLDELSESISKIKIGKTGYIMVLSPQHKFIVSSRHPEWILKTPDEAGLEGLTELEKANVTNFITDIDGASYVINIHSSENGWKIISAVKEEEILGQANRVTRILVYIYIITIIFVLLILYPLMNHMIKPILTISEEIKRMSGLDFNNSNEFKTLIKRSDEIGTVAIAFVEMQEKVNHYVERLMNNNIEITTKNDMLTATEEELTAQLEEINQQKDYIDYLAYHDHLTKLPNRRMFMEHLLYKINNSQKVAVILLDLDNFKEINDVRGHVYGDKVLIQIAKRFEEIVDHQIFISRFGGDEFLFLVEYDKEESEIDKYVVQIINLFDNKILIDNSEIVLHCSMGISLYPKNSSDVNQLIMQADLAMYSVKNSGKNGYRFFDEDMMKNQLKIVDIENILREALKGDGFVILYQPMVDIRTNTIIAYEALLRLKDHPISPVEFINVAEKNGLIIPIGRVVTEKVICQMHQWRQEGMDMKPISINFSANQLQDSGYIQFLQGLLSTYRIDPSLLEIEITENIFMDNYQLPIAFLNQLKSMGITIAIDDFGTGYSSLNYLSFLPVDIVKLDRSLIMKFLEINNVQVMESLIALVHSLGLSVVAEGIETKEYVDILRQVECDFIQGYYFSRPLMAEQIPSINLVDYNHLK